VTEIHRTPDARFVEAPNRERSGMRIGRFLQDDKGRRIADRLTSA
jgi:hypothetical protein